MTPVSRESSTLANAADLARVHVVASGDDVGVAVSDLGAGEALDVDGRRIVTREAIARGHKIALREIGVGESVRKYGWPIGRALRAIAAGEHVHTANLGTRLEGLHEYAYRGGASGIAPVGSASLDSMASVGTGSATLEAAGAAIPAFTHPFGCSQLGDDLARTRPGLALLEAPGNDAVSSTALVAAGATVLLFTTGRGTPLGFAAPTLKIASNSAPAQKKPHWIDFDAGAALGGAKSMQEAGAELMRLVIDTASGKLARNEQNGEREISIWKGGVTL